MRMVAEAFQEATQDQELLDHPELTFPKNFDMLELYDCFLHAKYRVYAGKIGVNVDFNKVQKVLFTEGLNKRHMRLAVRVLFPEMQGDFIGEKLPSEEEEQEMNLVGIVQCIDDRIVFTHRTFAEYFAAGFLADRLSRGKNSQKYQATLEFLAKELFKSENEVIKTFLDYYLAKNRVHAAILKGKLDLDNVISLEENVDVTDNLGRTAVHYAAQEGYEEIVDALINNGADIRKPDELGKTALHYAARYNRGEQVVSCLLEKAKDYINNKDKNGRTAVYYAAQQGNWDIVDRILTEKGASVEGLNAKKLLFHYTYTGVLNGIEKVVEDRKKEINVTAIKDSHDNTLLHIAARKGHFTVVEFLLKEGADVDVTDNSGKKPIDYAAEKEHWDIVESLLRIKDTQFNNLSSVQKDLLLEHSAQNAHWDIVKLFIEDNNKDNYFGHLDDQQRVEFLCYLICSKDFGVAEFMIARGTKVNMTDGQGKKPIHYAAENGYWSVVESLLRKDADFRDLNNNEQKPSLLRYSAKKLHWDIVMIFIQSKNNSCSGVDLLSNIADLPMDRDKYFAHLEDKQKMRFLQYVISIGNLDITRFCIERLIQKGKISDINTPNRYGKTFLHLAAQDGQLEIAQYLVDKKRANVNATTNTGSTPLHLASQSNKLNMVEYLTEKGAILTVTNASLNTPKDLATEKGYTNVAKFLRQAQERLNSSLVVAINEGNINLVKKLIEQGADFNVKDNRDMTPLQLAAKNDHLSIVKYLIEEKGVNSSNIFDAVESGCLGLVRYLVDKGIDINTRGSYGSTLLHLAALNGKLEIVRYLVERGANLSFSDDSGKIPLEVAHDKSIIDFLKQARRRLNEGLISVTREGNFYLVKELIEKGADINIESNKKCESGWTLLHIATYYNHLNVVQYLVEKGANFNAKDSSYYGYIPMHYAAERGHLDILKYFINEGAYINTEGERGWTLLHIATYYNHLNVVQYLVEKGANFNAKDSYYGYTPMHYAAERGHLDILKYFINEGAYINTEGERGWTLLHVATYHKHLDVVKYLVGRGAYVNAKASSLLHGEVTPLHLAAKYNYFCVAAYLVDKGANIGARDYYDRTPLYYADEKSTGIYSLLTLGTRHPDTLNICYVMAMELEEKHQYREALEAYQYVFDKKRIILGQKHSDVLAISSVIRRVKEKIDNDKCSIQHYGKQHKAFLDLYKFIFNYITHVKVESIRQGLYLPSFEARNLKINGKCTSITRGLSQAAFFGNQQQFLNNLATSAELYERLAQGKQISDREKKEIFAFSKLLDSFAQQLDSPTSSLSSALIYTKGYGALNNLLCYIAGMKDDFAIHLVTNNHVIAIYRKGDTYSYFDTNVAFVSGLQSVDQLMQVIEKGIKSAGYEVGEKGLLVEHFDVFKANSQLSNEDQQILAKEIKTERQLLAEQDKEFGLIKINDREVSRVQLYDFGTKINVAGGVPLLINADMNLSSKKFQDHLDKKEVSMTAREYLNNLKDSTNVEQATKFIPFAGSKREIAEAEQVRSSNKTFSLQQLTKGIINQIFSIVSQNNANWPGNQLPGKAGNKPKTHLSSVTTSDRLTKTRLPDHK
ncbi:ankyrin repeat domain-containing protein [Wolbachia endosymbiont of Pentalonia nigronervosa]|uniref:ankyrin repeat domain-containing protein n=1 Tax=Wolbachia endosymbiont of Pentalonia nigronervosa TaxID=1301914 RepID=UPI00165EDACF|nr:ankyrin repeat domain-containing protein [Wolbachia endosymbiont of Pentalonia nigronervosa]